MNITLNAPPVPTGDNNQDIERLYSWCCGFYSQMKRILYSLDTSNIIELDASHLNGILPLDSASLEGANVTIKGDSFSISTPDGGQYLKLENGNLTFCGTVVSNG